MTTTHTTARVSPGLARLRKSPRAAAAKLAGATTAKAKKRSGDSPSDPKKVAKGSTAGGTITVVDSQRTFAGQTGQCWALVKAAATVDVYVAAGTKVGVSRARLRFCLRHFATTLKVVRVT